MTIGPLCTRHGMIGDPQGRLGAFLESLGDKARPIISVIDYDGILWITWERLTDLSQIDDSIESAWCAAGGHSTAHFKNVDFDFNYMEDCASTPADDMHLYNTPNI